MATVNTYCSELGYGSFCDSCIEREVKELPLEHLVFVCESSERCGGCNVKSNKPEGFVKACINKLFYKERLLDM